MLKLVMECLPNDSDPLKELLLDLASDRVNSERLWEAQEQEFVELLADVDELAGVLLRRMLGNGVRLKGDGPTAWPKSIGERKAMLNWR
jgi:hypothetical protein